MALAVGVGAFASPMLVETAHAAVYNCSTSAQQVGGNMFLYPSTTSTGIRWRGSITGFFKSSGIQYCSEVYKGTTRMWKGQTSTYYTDRYGNHSQGSNYPLAQQMDCGKGTYTIYMWVISVNGQRSPMAVKTITK